MSSPRVVVYHRATGFVHASIPTAVAAAVALLEGAGMEATATDDPDALVAALDDGAHASVFVHTSGDPLPDPTHRKALERHVTGGGGWVGIHGAAAVAPETVESWPWFRDLVGGALTGHTIGRLWCDTRLDDSAGSRYAGLVAAAPDDAEELGPGLLMRSWEPATVRVETPDSPIARGLVDGGTRSDEWYGFDPHPRLRVEVVATVDEDTYDAAAGRMGDDHPVIWWQRVGEGVAVYNAMGHAAAVWSDETFLAGVLGAVEVAVGRARP